MLFYCQFGSQGAVGGGGVDNVVSFVHSADVDTYHLPVGLGRHYGVSLHIVDGEVSDGCVREDSNLGIRRSRPAVGESMVRGAPMRVKRTVSVQLLYMVLS